MFFLLFFAAVFLMITACSPKAGQDDASGEPERQESVRPLTASELITLGEKFLLELDYEQAIVHLLACIEIEPKNEDAYILLADAYIQAGDPVRGQGALEMGFVMLPGNDVILDQLFSVIVENDDSDAMGRIVNEMSLLDTFEANIIEKHIQELADSGNTEFLEKLLETLNEQEAAGSALPLFLELLLISQEDYEDEEARIEAVMQLIESRQIPELAEGEELYAGELDDEGRRNGFGIVYYGDGVKQDSVMYIGNWANGVRSGNGIAYNSSGEFIKGSWANDLPNGQLTYIEGRRGYTIVGSFSDGLGHGTASYYSRGGALDSIHFVPKAGVTQTFESRPDLFDWTDASGDARGDCPCVHIAWDTPVPGN